MSNLLTLTLFYTRMFRILYSQGKRSTEEDEKGDWEKLLWKAEKQVHLTTKHECKGSAKHTRLQARYPTDNLRDHEGDECESECKFSVPTPPLHK